MTHHYTHLNQHRRAEPVDEAADTCRKAPESDAVDDALADVDFPASREHGPATMRELVEAVMPEHPLGYDVDDALATIEGSGRDHTTVPRLTSVLLHTALKRR